MVRDKERRLQDYLETTVATAKQTDVASEYHYCCAEDFLLQNGQFFEPRSLSSEYPEGELRSCFSNATDLLCHFDALRYVEGMAFVTEPIPVHHAWCIDAEAKVVDTTWQSSASVRGVGDGLNQETLRGDVPSPKHDGVDPRDIMEAASFESPEEYHAVVQRINKLSKDAAYFGVCFPTDFVILTSLRASQGNGYHGVLDDERCLDFLRREPFEPGGLCRLFD